MAITCETKMKKSIIIPFLIATLIGVTAHISPVKACTSAIITAKASESGRPLLWKHRDTGQEQNRVEYFTTGKYPFLAIVNFDDVAGTAWTGTNSVGFSIMNTASYNLKDDDVTDMDKEGLVMYKALESCATLSDFEKMLDKLPRPMGVEANFGVIDAQGGAAYYEVNNHSWVKVDVNDPKIAPNGYLVYTNFSYTGRVNEGSGYMRYQTATEIFGKKAATADFSPRWIFDNLSRSFFHSLLGYDLCDPAYSPDNGNGWFVDQDFIPRRISTCSVVIEGVNKGQDPSNTIMWTVMGYPPAGVCIPLWVSMEEKQPQLLTKSDNSNLSELCNWAVELKHLTFPIERGNGDKYMKFSLIYNKQGTGYMQQLHTLEQELYSIYDQVIPTISGKEEVTQMYDLIQEKIRKVYERL